MRERERERDPRMIRHQSWWIHPPPAHPLPSFPPPQKLTTILLGFFYWGVFVRILWFDPAKKHCSTSCCNLIVMIICVNSSRLQKFKFNGWLYIIEYSSTMYSLPPFSHKIKIHVVVKKSWNISKRVENWD